MDRMPFRLSKQILVGDTLYMYPLWGATMSVP
jgi:hypothetical protein